MPSYRATDDTELHYDLRGDGPPVIVLHGGASRHPDYLGDLAGLSERFQLVIPHLRGVGRSASPLGPVASWWHQAADVEQLRLHLGLERAVIAAHSAGTRVAIAFAAQHPDAIDRMLLITPPAAYLVDEPSDVAEIGARRTDDAFRAATARLGDSSTTQVELEQWALDTAPAGYARWGATEQEHATIGRMAFEVNRAFFSVEPPADLPSRLRAVTAPVLVLAGREDALTGAAQAVALARLFADGRATVLDDCGHYPWVEQPAAFGQAAVGFLAAASS